MLLEAAFLLVAMQGGNAYTAQAVAGDVLINKRQVKEGNVLKNGANIVTRTQSALHFHNPIAQYQVGPNTQLTLGDKPKISKGSLVWQSAQTTSFEVGVLKVRHDGGKMLAEVLSNGSSVCNLSGQLTLSSPEYGMWTINKPNECYFLSNQGQEMHLNPDATTLQWKLNRFRIQTSGAQAVIQVIMADAAKASTTPALAQASNPSKMSAESKMAKKSPKPPQVTEKKPAATLLPTTKRPVITSTATQKPLKPQESKQTPPKLVPVSKRPVITTQPTTKPILAPKPIEAPKIQTAKTQAKKVTPKAAVAKPKDTKAAVKSVVKQPSSQSVRVVYAAYLDRSMMEERLKKIQTTGPSLEVVRYPIGERMWYRITSPVMDIKTANAKLSELRSQTGIAEAWIWPQ